MGMERKQEISLEKDDAMTKEERHYECLQKVLYITWQSNTL